MPEKPRHTPGPWIVHKYGGIGAGKYGLNPLILSSQWEAGYYQGGSRDVPKEEMAANARLIAAAPDMWEVILRLCDTEPQGDDRDGWATIEWAAEIVEAAKAIKAKVESEQ